MAERPGIHRTSLRLPDHVKAILKRQAAAEGCSMNTWMLRALEQRVREDLAELARTGKLRR